MLFILIPIIAVIGAWRLGDLQELPAPDATYPLVFPEMRGHHLTVIAVDPTTGKKADYSNGCGPLPAN